MVGWHISIKIIKTLEIIEGLHENSPRILKVFK